MLRIISNRDSNSVTVQVTDYSWHFKDAYVYYENQIVTIVSSKDSRDKYQKTRDKYQKKLFVTSLVNTIIEFR